MNQIMRCLSILWIILFSCAAGAAEFKVLVVMSYEVDFPWCDHVKAGIESVLKDACDIEYAHMDTKKNFAGGALKARQAFARYQELKPDGVIVSDDDAQAMFVVPYLKDRVKTPVMFCGVNAEPQKYGYPASNVSGILERPHFGESLAFAQQLSPGIATFGFMVKDSPTGIAHYSQIQRESAAYPARLSAFRLPKTVQEVVAMTEELRQKSDTLLLATLAGILDADGKPLSEKQAIQIALKTFGDKPTIGAEDYTVHYGALCTVVRTGEEQGETAAKMLLSTMRGAAVSQMPITRNARGKRIINATVMKALGIKPRPEILRGAELVRTQE